MAHGLAHRAQHGLHFGRAAGDVGLNRRGAVCRRQAPSWARNRATSALAWPWPMPCSLLSRQATISMCFRPLLLLQQLEPMADRLAVGLLDGREVGRGAFDFVFGGMGNSGGWPREQGGVSKACVQAYATSTNQGPPDRRPGVACFNVRPIDTAPEGDPMAMPHAGSGELIPIRPRALTLPQHRTRALVKTARLELVRWSCWPASRCRHTRCRATSPLQCLEGAVMLSLGTPSPCGLASWSIWRAAPHMACWPWKTHPAGHHGAGQWR